MRTPHLLLVGLLVTGCSLPLLRQAGERERAAELVARAEQLAQAGDYQKAEDAYGRALEASAQSPAADRALFGLARLHAAPENPERNYHRAHQYFDRLLKEYPGSPWTRDARAWREALATVLAERERAAELERVKQLELETERRRHRDELAEGRRETQRLRLEVQRARQEVERIRQDFERLKQVELDLERLRRR